MQFCKGRRFEAYYASDRWDRNGPIINLDAGRFLFQQIEDTIYIKMYITVEPLQRSPRSNELFF